ncbi:MAG TPA: hypothetical protein PK493_18375 [Pseudomonadota bacterium]|nr:hypothetical protein [Pseudomonadota bacterium]
MVEKQPRHLKTRWLGPVALAMPLLSQSPVASAHPMRPETGLPYSAEAKEKLPEKTPASPGQLQGSIGPLRLGIVGDLFATYRLVDRQDQVFHEFELSRIQLSGWASYEELAGVNITVDTVRSSSNRSYQGVDGDAILPRLKWAFAEATPWKHYVALRAGIVPDLLLQYAEASWGYRVQGPTGLERDALYTPGDLGASVEVALPWQLGAAAIQVGNGEGISLREQNNGKNLTGVLRLAPLRSQAPDLLIHLLFRDGSIGAGTAADRRGSVGITYASPKLGAGAVGTLALGYRGIGDRFAGHLSTWLRGELPACFGLLGRIDALWPDVSSRQDVQLRVIGGVSYSLPSLVRLIASYEGTVPFGGLAGQVPSITEHAMLIQAEVRL